MTAPSLDDRSCNREIHSFPVFPGDQDFCIDREDFTVVHEILDISGINYKLTKVQRTVSTDQERRVYKLCMPDNDKILTIPPSIGTLKHLQQLLLGKSCGAVTSLPHSIGELQKLEHLCLRGSEIAWFPSTIGKLNNLRVLDISYTKYLLRLPPEVGNLTALKKLNLKGSAIIWLPPSCRRLKNLDPLDISKSENLLKLTMAIFQSPQKICWNCYGFAKNCVDDFDPKNCSIFQSPQKTRWNCYGFAKNCVDGFCFDPKNCSVRSLPLRQMEHFNLESLGISFPNYTESPSSTENQSIRRRQIGIGIGTKRLDLSHSSMLSLPKHIGRLRNLKDLDLSFTKWLRELPEEIGDLCSLEKLNLSHSDIRHLPSSMGRLQNLKELDLSSMHNIVVDLHKYIPRMSSLKHLDLSGLWQSNSLQKCTDGLTGLVHLNVKGGYFTELQGRDPFEFLMALIKRHPSMESLVVATEDISRSLHRGIPDAYTRGHRGRVSRSEPKLWRHIMDLAERLRCMREAPNLVERLRCMFEAPIRLDIALLMVCKQEEMKLRVALACRNKSCWSLPALWPLKLKNLTHGFDQDYHSTKNYELLRRAKGFISPQVREADVIYRFLQDTICRAPYHLRRDQPFVV